MQLAQRLPHVGLSPEPTVTKQTPTIACKVVELPYMGPHKLDDAVKTPYPTDEYRLKAYQEKEAGSEASKPEEFTDPCELLIRKVNSLSRILKCTEAEAQRILFNEM